MKKWYTEKDDKLVDIKGEPQRAQIEEAYKCSCWEEPDADLNCASCVIQFLLEKIDDREQELAALKR